MIALAFTALLIADVYYVDPAGNDGANGSSSTPWATLQHAADTVSAGDSVIVRAGTYVGFQLTTSGTQNAPITFTGETGAVVNANNPMTTDGINLEGASYVVVEGMTVTGVTRAGIRAVTCHDVIIRNNVLDQNGRWGVLTGFCDDLLIEGNQASRSGIEHGIYVSNSGDRPTIRNNRIFGNNANGIHMNGDVSLGGDGIISNALVEANTIWDNGTGGGSGINCDGVQDSEIRNNLIYNTHASGISLYRIDGGAPSMNNLVVNNTVVVASNGRWALNIQDGSGGNRVFNNILVNLHPSRGSIDISSDSLMGFVSDHNVVLDRLTSDDGNTILTLANWTTATGQDASSVAVSQAAVSTDGVLFVSPSADNYRLANNSPALNAGQSQDAPSEDLEGTVRPQNGVVDIGAYETCVGAGCGAATDGGVSADAGMSADAGVGTDANVSTDANVGTDAGVSTDAGASADANVSTDAGANADAGGNADAASRDASDAGPRVDSGVSTEPEGTTEGGCGCALTASEPSAFVGWLALVLLAGMRRGW